MSNRLSRNAHWVVVASVLSLLNVPAAIGASPTAGFQEGVAALQRGDSPAAEQKLKAELKLNPNEADALSLLGVALDNQRKFPEADGIHRQAMANSPSSPGILNNYGNHLLLTGNPQEARDAFLKAVAADPSDDYANIQLAQLAIKANHGAEALQYLDHVSVPQLAAPNVAIFRLVALDQTVALKQAGNRAEADLLFNRLASVTENDAPLSASLGRTLVQAGQFAQAETFLTHALAPDPANFNLLFQLGVVASRADHNERAREVLEKALRQQPQNVDVLYSLAFVYSALKQPEAAVRLLAQAARLAPQRADVQKLLAVSAADIHAFEDSVAAWDRYAALAPEDDAGRRERGFARANIKQPTGMADLEWYEARHPADPIGLYELGVSQAVDDPDKGLATLDKAIAIQPDYVEARSARGGLYYQQGKAEAALGDLEFAAAKQPDNALVLDRLGQTYLLLDRGADAIRVLRHAAELAPGDAKTQLHVANSLGAAGLTAESKVFMQRYRELGGGVNVMARGVLDYLNLTPEQQHADYRARVEKGIKEHPDDVATQVLYLKLSIAEGQMEQAAVTARKIADLKPGSVLLADAGRALLAAKQYLLAKQLLEQAAATGSSADLNLEIAVASFHTDGLNAGVERLDRVPLARRGGDYYLARAQMLNSSGKPEDAIAAIEKGISAEPMRPDLYWQAAVLMMQNHRAADVPPLLDRAAKVLPQEAQIPVIKAAMLEVAGETADALQLLTDTQHRWPEVAAVWVARGIILAANQQPDAARKALATAVTLGAHSPEVEAASRDASGMEPAKLFLTKPPQDW